MVWQRVGRYWINPLMSDHRIIRPYMEGNSEVEDIIRNSRRADRDSYMYKAPEQ